MTAYVSLIKPCDTQPPIDQISVPNYYYETRADAPDAAHFL